MFQRDYVIPTTNYPLLKCSGCSKRIAKSGLQAHTARPRPPNQSAFHVCMRRPKSCLAVQIRASRVLNEGATAKQKQEGRTERMQNTQCFSCTRWNDEGCRSCTGRRRNRLLGVWQPGGLPSFSQLEADACRCTGSLICAWTASVFSSWLALGLALDQTWEKEGLLHHRQPHPRSSLVSSRSVYPRCSGHPGC